ncbi:hypothetical protein HXZ65_07680 [Acinetobacter indicus]|uniref:hypothetical protein n=1 Tax=Acinetobacter indicus TaxID=756892 RepID=UPI0025787E5A|nr:hypothetical protein [Acinetobacter indicus]MDM1278129.1 hypothetical protein [Acinetobacter indicus]
MDLFYLLLNLREFPKSQLIYTTQPWSLEAEVLLLDAIPNPAAVLSIGQQVYHLLSSVEEAYILSLRLGRQNLCSRERCQQLLEQLEQSALSRA